MRQRICDSGFCAKCEHFEAIHDECYRPSEEACEPFTRVSGLLPAGATYLSLVEFNRVRGDVPVQKIAFGKDLTTVLLRDLVGV